MEAATATIGRQLTLDVGGEVGAAIEAKFAFAGTVESSTTELERDEEVMLTVTDADGVVILKSPGWVKKVAIETKPATKNAPRYTVRHHSIKLGEIPEDA